MTSEEILEKVIASMHIPKKYTRPLNAMQATGNRMIGGSSLRVKDGLQQVLDELRGDGADTPSSPSSKKKSTK